MNMIVTTNEVLQLKYNKRENNFCSGDSLCSSMRSRHPCPSLPGICQIKMYFPSLLIIFPIFPVKIQYVCPPQVMLHRQLSNWGHICLYQVMMIMVMVEMIDWFLFSNYHKPSKYNLLRWQQITSNIFFRRILLRLPCSDLLPHLFLTRLWWLCEEWW